MRALVLGLAAMLSGTVSGAQSDFDGAVVSFQFEWPASKLPGYTFQLGRDGKVVYSQVGALETVEAKRVSAPLEVSKELTAKVFRQAAELTHFNLTCSSKAKNIADTGVKTLSYKGPDGVGSCSYNYTQNETVQELTKTFQAMAMTLEEGRKLEREHRYDRLALYGEMTTLTGLVKDGRAVEMGLIGATLKSLADDPEVLEKVRGRAADLLKGGR